MGRFSEYVTRKSAAKKLNVQQFLMMLAGEASGVSLITHSGKFTNPSVKIDLYCNRKASQELDCYCFTAYDSIVDGIGSVRAVSTAALLGLILEDGRSVYYHLAENSEMLKNEIVSLGISEENYNVLRKMFQEAKPVLPPLETTRLLKQVYFPVADGYHILSIMNSSVFLKRISDKISEFTAVWDYQDGKKARGKHWGEEFHGISDVTEIHVGGANPQNVSGLNVLNAGKFLMIPSVPPVFKQFRKFPRSNFFNKYFWKEKADMEVFHESLLNYRIRHNATAKDQIRVATDLLLENMFSVIMYFQDFKSGWSDHEKCNIPIYQKVYLDSKYTDKDIREVAGMDKKTFYVLIAYDMLGCIISCYNQLFDNAYVIGDDVRDILYKRCRAALLF